MPDTKDATKGRKLVDFLRWAYRDGEKSAPTLEYGNDDRSDEGADGKDIPPTGKSFHVNFCTVARWDDDGRIIEENLFYDLVTFMKQIGLSK